MKDKQKKQAGVPSSNGISRRDSLQGIGAMGTLALLTGGAGKAKQAGGAVPGEAEGLPSPRKEIFQKVWETAFIDTHEHLRPEKDRLNGKAVPKGDADDWTLLMCQYFDNDLQSAGMPDDIHKNFFSPGIDPVQKWEFLKPYWPAVQHTGYGQAVALSIRELYGVEELSAATIPQVQAGYEKIRQPGFYRHILRERANIESCQVNGLSAIPFTPSDMPDLLMQDLSALYMIECKKIKDLAKPAGIEVKSLSDWHRVIDWWFETFGDQAVAVKSQHAYSRDINHEWVEAEQAEGAFQKYLAKESLPEAEIKAVGDHLFWYIVKKATQHHLPVKLHTGYYAGVNRMPLGRVRHNPGSACDICKLALDHEETRDARFVFMHIGYPYYEEMIALAKQYPGAAIDMCWSWIINPVASKDFLKKFLVTAPANKILTFGGDYRMVEVVLGHSIIARRGIALALSELVEEGWLTRKGAIELADPIMNGNARRIFRLS